MHSLASIRAAQTLLVLSRSSRVFSLGQTWQVRAAGKFSGGPACGTGEAHAHIEIYHSESTYRKVREGSRTACSSLGLTWRHDEPVSIAFSLQAAIENPRAKTVIGLEGGAIWLGMSTVATADLFVRNCYLELFEARESYIKAANWEHGCQIVFTGTPGVCRDA